MRPAERAAALQEALAYGGHTHTAQDVAEQILTGEAALFENEDGFIVVEVKDLPLKRVLHFWLAAGNLDAVIALSYEALAWGKTIGCQRATMAGRRGWERVLAPEGWKPALTILERSIEL